LANPQYSLPNIYYSLFKQLFEDITNGVYEQFLTEYRKTHDVSDERLQSQMALLADLLDALTLAKYPRDNPSDTGRAYMETVMRHLDWQTRYDETAMRVLDILAHRRLLTYYFRSLADGGRTTDICPSGRAELTETVERLLQECREL
jgi:hypothetical protein